MKTIYFYLITIISIFSFNPMIGQPQLIDAFEGTWQYKSGNQVFILSLWKNSQNYKGHYKLITVDGNGNPVSILYNSNKPYGTSGENWFPVIQTSLANNGIIGGSIIDNSINTHEKFLQGIIKITLINSNPLTVNLKISKSKGLRPADEPEFNIPTDIVLTKVSNTVNP